VSGRLVEKKRPVVPKRERPLKPLSNKVYGNLALTIHAIYAVGVSATGYKNLSNLIEVHTPHVALGPSSQIAEALNQGAKFTIEPQLVADFQGNWDICIGQPLRGCALPKLGRDGAIYVSDSHRQTQEFRIAEVLELLMFSCEDRERSEVSLLKINIREHSKIRLRWFAPEQILGAGRCRRKNP
jgi:hypothetical protein